MQIGGVTIDISKVEMIVKVFVIREVDMKRIGFYLIMLIGMMLCNSVLSVRAEEVVPITTQQEVQQEESGIRYFIRYLHFVMPELILSEQTVLCRMCIMYG